MMKYRDAAPADADALSALGIATFVETFGQLYRTTDLAVFLESHRPEVWAAALADPAYAVRLAEADGDAVGYAMLGPHAMPFAPTGTPIELRRLYVLGPCQGAGVAAVLMDWVLATARGRGADELYLSVFSDNHRARRFYDRYGFVFVQPYQFMVGDQADEDHILRLAL